jgi:hypothetical protein
MAKRNNSREAKLAADEKLIAGTQTYLTQFSSLPVGSQKLAPADIVKLLQSRVDAGNAAEAASAAFDAAVKGERDVRAKTASFVTSLRRVVTGMFSQSPDTLAVFGLSAPKAGKKSAATKAEAAVKASATRASGGKKKKAKAATPASASTKNP